MSSADRIRLTGLHGWGHHGVLESEREAGQEFWVDVELELDVADASASDDLAQTVDYGLVAQQIYTLITGEPVNLIETLAERIAQACLTQVLVSAVTVTVYKPQAPISVPFENVSVTIRRVRADV